MISIHRTTRNSNETLSPMCRQTCNIIREPHSGTLKILTKPCNKRRSRQHIHYNIIMDGYINTMLDPENYICGAPDPFYHRSSVFRVNSSFTLQSSVTNGHVLARFEPQYITTNTAFGGLYTDGSGTLNVLNYVGTGLLNTAVSSSNLTQFLYCRLVAFTVTLRYIGAELTQAGELSIGFDNYIVTTGANTNIKQIVHDMQFQATGRADSIFTARWMPQDYGDFEFRPYNTPIKGQQWGSITVVGTGFPKGIDVYDGKVNCIIEGLSSPVNQDFIPKNPTWIMPIEPVLAELMRIFTRPGTVCSSTDYSKTNIYVQQDPDMKRAMKSIASKLQDRDDEEEDDEPAPRSRPKMQTSEELYPRAEGVIGSLPYGNLALQGVKSAEASYKLAKKGYDWLTNS